MKATTAIRRTGKLWISARTWGTVLSALLIGIAVWRGAPQAPWWEGDRPIDPLDPRTYTARLPATSLLPGSASRLQLRKSDVRARDYDPDTVEFGTISSDSRLVLTIGAPSKTIRIWDAHSGQALQTLQGDTRDVNSAAFANDGARIITASDDNTARIWDTQSGQLLQILESHTSDVNGAAFANDGDRVITASDDNTAHIWDVHSGELLRILQGHTNDVASATFSNDGARAITTSRDHTARIWDVRSGKTLHVLRGHAGIVARARFSSDGDQAITASFDNTARIWNARNGQTLLVLSGHTSGVTSVAFANDGDRVMTASYDNTARIWDARSGAELGRYDNYGPILDADFSPAEDALVYGAINGRLNWLDIVPQQAGPPLWAVFATLLALTLLTISPYVDYRRRQTHTQHSLPAILSADEPVTRPELAGAALSAFSDKIARFLINQDTGAPFTIAITGDWGCGKSSAMTLIRRQLQQHGHPTVWFNAWHHQKEEQLFAALIEAIRAQTMPGADSWQFFSAHALGARWRLLTIRFRAQPLYFILWAFLLTIAIAMLSTLFDTAQPLSSAILGLLGIVSLILLPLSPLITVFNKHPWSWLRDKVGLQRFRRQLSFRWQFASAFADVTQALARQRLAIFIDDLDRCDATQVVDMMEAINFLADNGQCYVILGIHQAPVRHAFGLRKEQLARAHAIDQARGDRFEIAADDDLEGRQRERDKYADWYLRKLFNLRLKVPAFDGEAIANFLRRRVQGDTDDIRDHWWLRYRRLTISALNILGLCLAIVMGIWANHHWGISDRFAQDMIEKSRDDKQAKTTGDAVTTAIETPPNPETDNLAPAPPAQTIATFGGGVQQALDGARPNRQRRELQSDPSPATTGATGLWQRAIRAVVANPLYLLPALLPPILGMAGARLLAYRRHRQKQADIASGRRDSEAFTAEVSDCLRLFQHTSPAPRELTRFLNTARYLTAGMREGDETKIHAFVRLAALLSIKPTSNLERLNAASVNDWIREQHNTVRDDDSEQPTFSDDLTITDELLDAFKAEIQHVEFS